MRNRIRLRNERFAEELASRKLSQNAWSQRLGVSKAYLSQLVNGQRCYPGTALRRRILQELSLPSQELFEREGQDTEQAEAGLRRKLGRPASRPDNSADVLFEIRYAGLNLKLESEMRPHRGGRRSMGNLWREFQYAIRALRRNPGFSLVAILTLALAMGANTTLFSAISAVLLRPLPYPEPSRVVRIWSSNPTQGWFRGSLSPPDFVDLRKANRSFAEMGVFNLRNGNLTGNGRPSSIEYAWVTPSLLTALAVPPKIGRLFAPEENEPGADGVAIISHRLWASAFGNSPSIVGENLTLNGRNLTVVGVMPESFRYPSPQTDLWKPFGTDLSDERDRGSSFVSGVGRLREGVPLEQAQQDGERIARDLEAAFPEANQDRSFFLETLHDAEVRSVRQALITLWGAVGLILLIACVNVANLLLARAAGRRREFSVRSVLGAGPGRVIRQLLLECLVLATCATLSGLALAAVGNRFLLWLAADRLPRIDQIQFDWQVGLFTVGLTLLTTLLFGLAPALHATRVELADALRDRSAVASPNSRLRNALVVGQVALALVLLSGAGLMIRSFNTLLSVDLGFDPDHLITFRVEPPMIASAEGRDLQDFMRDFEDERWQMTLFMQDLLSQLSSLPGVTQAGAINRMPLTGNMWQTAVVVDGRTYERRQDRHPATSRNVMPGYFETMGIPLLRGRDFGPLNPTEGHSSVIINRAMAEAYWPGEDPTGDRITFNYPPPSEAFWLTIIGVAENVRHISLAIDPVPVMYIPMSQTYFGYFGNWGMDVLLRSQTIPAGFASQVERIVAGIQPELPIPGFRAMDQVMSEDISSRRFSLVLIGFFAVLALILAFVGIYGVISYLAAQKRREFGVRTALGARPRDLLNFVVKQSTRVILLGISLGLGASILLSGYIVPLLYQVSPSDPLTLTSVAVLMLVVGTAASLYPAWKASRIDAIEVLRSGGN